MATILVPLATGFEEIEAVSLIDILRRANITVLVASIDGNNEVQGANRIMIKSDCSIIEIEEEDIDMILLPGGWGGTNILAEDKNVQKILKTMDNKNKKIGAICAAPFALHIAGVLKENFTCYPGAQKKIRLNGYNSESNIVEDGNIITSRGPATAICFALYLVKMFCGNEVYEKLKSGLLTDYC